MKKRTLHPAAGFTLVEVMVVVIIVAALIAILVPTINSVRTKAHAANTQSFVSQLASAIDRYYQDWKAYPGPLPNDSIRSNYYWNSIDFTTAFPGNSSGGIHMNNSTGWKNWTGDGSADYKKVTMAENLVLGLLGGLRIGLDSSGGNAELFYDPTIVGTGPRSLNPANLKKFEAYIQVKENDLSWQVVAGAKTGEFFDEASIQPGGGSDPGGAEDSIIPEFVDKFPDPMPILYLRARRGAARASGISYGPQNNGIVNEKDSNINPTDYRNRQQYDLDQIIGYTGESPVGLPSIGVGKKRPTYYEMGSPLNPQPTQVTHGLRTVHEHAVSSPKTDPNYFYPYDAFSYLRNSALSGPLTPPEGNQIAREKDKYILISAGPDRIYGTDDDITTFGSVGQ